MEDSPELAQLMHHLQSSSSTSAQPSLPESTATPGLLPNGKKTKGGSQNALYPSCKDLQFLIAGRVKIKMEYIGNKLRRYTTFSKRKTGIMKKLKPVPGPEHGLTLGKRYKSAVSSRTYQFRQLRHNRRDSP
ncbi:hypothetical protein ANCDUO_13359 [Ancylostoma duodenale]|uniref:MADS-box domain-containing protein n=1 Tax=Ancylostoma duodenale TaxID=51022 RepID=A0A0C2G659_9BILA|nr:hypothetical protein ANCDUO_13359 [Ancylostoma duodenale]